MLSGVFPLNEIGNLLTISEGVMLSGFPRRILLISNFTSALYYGDKDSAATTGGTHIANLYKPNTYHKHQSPTRGMRRDEKRGNVTTTPGANSDSLSPPLPSFPSRQQANFRPTTATRSQQEMGYHNSPWTSSYLYSLRTLRNINGVMDTWNMEHGIRKTENGHIRSFTGRHNVKSGPKG